MALSLLLLLLNLLSVSNGFTFTNPSLPCKVTKNCNNNLKQQQQQQQAMHGCCRNVQWLSTTQLRVSDRDQMPTQQQQEYDEEEYDDDDEEEVDPTEAALMNILNSPTFLERKIEILKEDLEHVNHSIELYKRELKLNKQEWGPRIEALEQEFKEADERLMEQNQSNEQAAAIQVAIKMLPVLDRLQNATTATDSNLQSSVSSTYQQFYNNIWFQLKSFGVEEIETVGKNYNKTFHLCTKREPSRIHASGIVSQELRKGFMFNSTVIRPASVIVAQ